MKINISILEKIKKSNSKLLLVTKYLDKEKTLELTDFVSKNYNDILFGFGENRVSVLKEKKLVREKTHFIGNIQTKEIKHIVNLTSCIHSVWKIKHLEKIEEICLKNNLKIKIFIQINLDEEKESGIKETEIVEFLRVLKNCKNVKLLGFSGIGKYNFTKQEKDLEFERLKNLRDRYFKNGIISAGTSIDYEIAMKNGIEILRIGTAIIK